MNLYKLLPKMFEQLDKQFTGYSNAASIERHAKEAGASACTDTSKLSMQDMKADAVWLFEKIKLACNDYELCLIIANYGQGFSLYNDAVEYIKEENTHYKLHDDLVNMYFKVNDNSLRQVSIKNNVSYKTAQCAKLQLS